MEFNFSADSPKLIKRNLNAGEDAPPVSKNGILIVCDGTGATGMSKHEYNGETHTSAYLGSRKTSEIAECFISNNYDDFINAIDDGNALNKLVTNLGNQIRTGLSKYVKDNDLKLTVRGRAFKLLPTTLAAAIYKSYEDHVDIIALSAGDSRVLLWNPEDGLQQLSVDDVESGYDAFSDVSNTNNCISADSDFRINYVVHSLPLKKCVLFATSDGFTDPIKPFDQERYLIQWLGNCDCVLNTEHSNLNQFIEKSLDTDRVAGFTGKDDCSIAGTIIGYENDAELKDSLRNRFSYVANNFSVPYRELDKKCKEAMDAYNSAGIEKRRYTEQINAKIRDRLIEGASILLPSNYTVNRTVYDFLSGQPFINSEIKKINIEFEEKLRRASEKRDLANKEVRELFVKFLKYYCFIATQNGINTGLPHDISWHLENHIKSDLSKKKACEAYNQALSNIRKLPEIKTDDSTSLNIDEIKILCNSIINASTEITRLNKTFEDSDRAIASFFSLENLQIIEIFERHKRSNFTEFDKFIDSLKPTKIFGIFNRNKDDEVEYNQLRRLKTEFDNALSISRRVQAELDSVKISDEERLSRYKAVIRNNINELVSSVMSDSTVFTYFTDEDKLAFESKMASSENSSESAKTLIELKNQLWQKYKPTYELFANSDKDYVCIPKNSEV